MFSYWRDSLHLRLLAGTLVWILVTVMAAGWGLSRLFEAHVLDQFDAQLQNHLNQLAAHILFDEDGKPLLAIPLSDPRFTRPYSGMYWQVDRIDPAGHYFEGALRSRSLWDSTLTLAKDSDIDGEIHSQSAIGPDGKTVYLIERILQPADQDGAIRLSVAGNTGLLNEPIEQFRGLLGVALAFLAAGLVLAAIFQVIFGLRPLGKLRKELALVRDGKALLLTGAFPSEIHPLVNEFNGVLVRNSDMVERARTHAGNLAHAVKTPLTVLANAARQEKSPFARLVQEQVETATIQIDRQLARARAAAAVQIPGQRTSLQKVVEGLVRVLTRVHAERNLELVIEKNVLGRFFHGEEQDLQEMLGNLLDNACKWAKHRIEIQAQPVSGKLLITIDDDGPGLPATEYEKVFVRGARADENTPGSGLGLAIVRDLATLYGGKVELAGSPASGLRVKLTLPGE